MDIGLLDILKSSTFNEALATGLVRHQDQRYPEIHENQHKWLEIYQAYQSKPVFHRYKQIISFYGLPGNRPGFFGLYRVLGYRKAAEGITDKDCPASSTWSRKSTFFYELERDGDFDYLADRLIIRWNNPRSWVQKLKDRPVFEILPGGRKLEPFTDYLEFSLSFDELRSLFSSDAAHGDWSTSLSVVAGVYLILDEDSGHQYVGSAYGANGIWGRWREYARSGHGGNKKLRELIKEKPLTCPKQFRFSVLQVLPKTMTAKQVIQRETFYKHKLGTRATGLNS